MTSANAIPVSERDGNDLGALTSRQIISSASSCTRLTSTVYCRVPKNTKSRTKVDDGLQMLDEG